MRAIVGLGLAFVLLGVGGAPAPAASPRAVQLAVRCFALPEQKVIGVNRICYYRCSPGSATSISIPATELCPDFIDR